MSYKQLMTKLMLLSYCSLVDDNTKLQSHNDIYLLLLDYQVTTCYIPYVKEL